MRVFDYVPLRENHPQNLEPAPALGTLQAQDEEKERVLRHIRFPLAHAKGACWTKLVESVLDKALSQRGCAYLSVCIFACDSLPQGCNIWKT